MFQHHYAFKYFTDKDYASLRRNLPDVPLYIQFFWLYI
jgi:hypothetical protein